MPWKLETLKYAKTLSQHELRNIGKESAPDNT